MPARIAVCPRCGWTRTYASRQARWKGLQRHLARRCEAIHRGGTEAAGEAAGAVSQARALARDRAGLDAAGIAEDHTAAVWVARWAEQPELLDDLTDVLNAGRIPREAHRIDDERRDVSSREADP